MIRTKYCGTAAKAGGNGENKPHPTVKGVSCLLTICKKRLSISAIVTACSFIFGCAALANNLTLTNQAMVAGGEGYTYVRFDISWNNSWRAKWEEPAGNTNINWDAAWVFMKYRVATNNARWQHASLSITNTDHSVVVSTAEATINVGLSTNAGGTNFGCGVFVYRSGEGNGNWTNTVKLRWNYALNGLMSTDRVDVSVQAIEMVYVPQGVFKVGSGGAESGSLTAGPWVSGSTVPFAITNESALMMTNDFGGLWGLSTSGNNTIGSTGVLATVYPKGYNAFYCMKYEITQGQWVDFFNLLTDTQKATRDITGGTYNSTGKGIDSETNRNTIAWTTGDATCTTPDRACNFLSWDDGVAYADWAGLRPMTELEFEKACRGPSDPVANEYAWATATIMSGTINLTFPEDGAETNTTSVISGAANYGDKYIQTNSENAGKGPIRAGLFATAVSTRITSGATFWGIMEMSGNLYEQVVTVGHNTGRLFTGSTGDGTLDSNGYAHYGFWPNASAAGAGFRGGDWIYISNNARTSDRNLAARANPVRYNSFGFRAVRSAVSGE